MNPENMDPRCLVWVREMVSYFSITTPAEWAALVGLFVVLPALMLVLWLIGVQRR